MDLTKLAAEDRACFAEHIKDAAYHLAMCWDALSEAEGYIGADCEIETDDIQALTGELGDPSEAYGLADDIVFQHLEVAALKE